MPLLLTVSFFVTAILYASVGFGGGSTYNALLVLSGTDYRVLPAISLACNIVVVSGGAIQFWRSKDLALRPLAPFLIASIPAAWIGGRITISESIFVGLLAFALLASGLRLALSSQALSTPQVHKMVDTPVALGVGASIGLLSGLVGIGGGIFLAPILYFLKWDTPRKIAAACSLFILANSISGLTGQVMKLRDVELIGLVTPYWPLLVAVFFGGQIGSWAASQRLQPMLIKRLTSILILYVALRLLYRWSRLMGWL